MPEVVIAGGGPSGLMLAGELALAGIDVAVMERRPEKGLAASRAGGIHCRTLEVLDQRGIAGPFLAAGTTAQTARFGSTVLDIGDFPTRHPYGLALWQSQFQPILEAWVEGLGVSVHYGKEVVGFTEDAAGVDVGLADGGTARARYLVGADGGRSRVRKLAGIGFPGTEATRSNLVAEVEVSGEPPAGMLLDEAGVHGFTPLADGRRYRVITTERGIGPREEPGLAELSAALRAAYGTDFGVHSPASVSRFTDATRQAASYSKGRVLLVGDAAHVHYPAGGQGIGLGVQDAVNLGWKLAQVLRGTSPESLLDTYHAERHPVGARALKHSMAQTALQRNDPRTAALREAVGELMAMDQPRRHVAALIHGLDITYDGTAGESGTGHPLLGRRMPDLDLGTAAGPARVYGMLHDARPLLLNLGAPGHLARMSLPARVRRLDAEYRGPWVLPVIGEVRPPAAVLVRPDGYVAWVGLGTDGGLAEALAAWFGGPA
ncbi:FAD-dependent monooxygenase [Paeniglutamicibacter sp. R2-26]|uniref:FAD-dependent monooxygenase n=1 Tax=Paeniglutamicibacter sp. R2-26 TaxID=3144417 RepID=UPI003EE58002